MFFYKFQVFSIIFLFFVVYYSYKEVIVIMTAHIEAKKEAIAPIVLCPGDPLRGKFIAENFLENIHVVNTVRNMTAYTGEYKGKRITIFPSGMGIPSMGIYSYELYTFYNVETIIRIGSCGTNSPDVQLLDTILVNNVYSESSFALGMYQDTSPFATANANLNTQITQTAHMLSIPLIEGNSVCTEFFDPYVTNLSANLARIPQDFSPIAFEMEAFALFKNAERLGKKAACLLTVVDSLCSHASVSSSQRETSLKNMILIALESTIS